MQTTYTPPNPIDTMMPHDFRKLEKSLPATPYEVLEKNLLWMVEHEPENPEYFGPRIRELSDRMGV
jgi:hypothetical protein